MLDVLRRVKRSAELELEKFRLRGVYGGTHDNLDVRLHIREAADWLRRAQDHGEDRGFSYGTRFGVGFLESYPETTGYIIPTFLALADVLGDPDFEQRAVEAGDWEIDVQMECGAVMGGRVNPDPTPAVFNTGQVLLGWASLAERTGEQRFLDAGRRAADWLLTVQDADGAWRRGNSQFAESEATVYNVKAAWGLGWFGKVAGDDRYIGGAVRNAEFALTRKEKNGWYRDCCLTAPERPLLHTVAYTMQGLHEVGLLADRTDFLDAARETADALLGVLSTDGFLAGRLNPDFSGAVPWCCLTGSAQTSIVFSSLYARAGDAKYAQGADRLNRYLMARHDVSSSDPTIRGGVPGSWPVWGDYGRFLILNWATKFLVDALLLQSETGDRDPSTR